MKMNLNYAIGEVLKEIRTEEKQLTLRQLSIKSAVALGYISEVERGQKQASVEVLESLAKALDYDLSDVIVLVGWKMKIGNESLVRSFQLDNPLQRA
jgi:transcriptional regulator with XRE-family HTH domain